jgi:nicotinic acid mononucleotide adenylyltransferase
MQGEIDFQKLEKQFKNLKNRTPTILTLGGSFNPVHVMHIHAFNVAKEHIDALGEEYVIGGFLIPSTDDYVFRKLEKDAIQLEHRNKMINLAISSSDWIMNCPWGEVNSFYAGKEIKKLILNKFPQKITELKVRPICGADFALNCHLFFNGDVVALGREGYNDKLLKYSDRFHEKFIFLQHEEMKDVSSTLVRDKLLKNEKIDETILHPEVSEYLINNFQDSNLKVRFYE